MKTLITVEGILGTDLTVHTTKTEQKFLKGSLSVSFGKKVYNETVYTSFWFNLLASNKYLIEKVEKAEMEGKGTVFQKGMKVFVQGELALSYFKNANGQDVESKDIYINDISILVANDLEEQYRSLHADKMHKKAQERVNSQPQHQQQFHNNQQNNNFSQPSGFSQQPQQQPQPQQPQGNGWGNGNQGFGGQPQQQPQGGGWGNSNQGFGGQPQQQPQGGGWGNGNQGFGGQQQQNEFNQSHLNGFNQGDNDADYESENKALADNEGFSHNF